MVVFFMLLSDIPPFGRITSDVITSMSVTDFTTVGHIATLTPHSAIVLVHLLYVFNPGFRIVTGSHMSFRTILWIRNTLIVFVTLETTHTTSALRGTTSVVYGESRPRGP